MLSRRSWRKSAAKKMVAGGPSEYCSVIRTALFAQRKKALVVDDVNDDGGTDDGLGTFWHPKKSLHKNTHKIAPPLPPDAEYNVSTPPSAITSDGPSSPSSVSLSSSNSALYGAQLARPSRESYTDTEGCLHIPRRCSSNGTWRTETREIASPA